jgi:predicted DNA-binding transcriptional regulator YafY
MQKELVKYMGRTVEIIYLDRNNKLTQRFIEVRAVSAGRVKAICCRQKAPRTFHIERILAVRPVIRHTG